MGTLISTFQGVLVCYLEINVPARRSYLSDFYQETLRWKIILF
ncbi:hypothetical protein PVE_R2G0723 [Pseudomonas veronii 1YdBTEX2]|uniref:Uncharacterized protein n=1 Tax=Pseudomonas veronii 1YdBTEX2 TaxID=1295141 RepID=A0A1D3K8R2_PSEVE|nr:hypothetical protein PVE_R2G0723 [Pseudomonas veronii 1YdBTEX2]